MKKVKVKIIFSQKGIIPESTIPKYATPGSSGCDIRSIEFLEIKPQEIKIVKTGIFLSIPEGYEIQVRSRSGLSSKGIIVLNSPGTIDSDYRGEIGVIIMNVSSEIFTINIGDRIAQMVCAEVIKIDFQSEDFQSKDFESYIDSKLGKTKRGRNGFGSTSI